MSFFTESFHLFIYLISSYEFFDPYHSIFTANSTEKAVALMTDSIKIRVKDAVNSGTLCQQFIKRGVYLNVTVLMSPEGLAAAGAVCDETPVFTTVFTPAMITQPSSSPSGQPSSSPTMMPQSSLSSSVVGTSSFIGILTIILLIAVLRFNSAMSALLVQKKDEPENHLYNILVVLNEDEEAILENIRHDDIIFFRETEIEDESTSNDWIMNATNEVLERRFEVQFYDQYDLLGQSGVDEDEVKCKHGVMGDKVVTKEIYVHKAKLLVGMIITVKELTAKGSGRGYRTDKVSQKCSDPNTITFSESHKSVLTDKSKPDHNFSMASIVEFGSTPSSPPQKQKDAPIFAFRDSLRNQGGPPSPKQIIKTLELSNVYDDDMWGNGKHAGGAAEYGLRHEEYHDDSEDSGEDLSIDMSNADSRGSRGGSRRGSGAGSRRGSTQIGGERARPVLPSAHGGSFFNMSAIFGGNNSSFREATPQMSPDSSRRGDPKARSKGKVYPGTDACDSLNSTKSADNSTAKSSIFGGSFFNMSAIFGGNNSSFREATPQMSPDSSRRGNSKARSKDKVHPGRNEADACDSLNATKSADGSRARPAFPSAHGGSFFDASTIHGGNNSSFRETSPFQSSPDSKGRSTKSADGSRARPAFPSAHGGSFFDASTIHGGNNSSFRETSPFQSSPDSSRRGDSKAQSKGTTGPVESTNDVENDIEEESEKDIGWKEYQTPQDKSTTSNISGERSKAAKNRWSIDSIPTLNDVDAMSPDSDPKFPRSAIFDLKNVSTHELPTIYDDENSEDESCEETSDYGLKDEKYHDECDDDTHDLSIELPLDESLRTDLGDKVANRLKKLSGSSEATAVFPSAHGGSFFDASTIHGGNNSSFRETSPFQSSLDSSRRGDSKAQSKGTTGPVESTNDVENDVEEESEKDIGWKEYQTPQDKSTISNISGERSKAAKNRWSIDSIPTLNDVDAMSPDSDPEFPRTGQFVAPVKKAISKSSKVIRKR